MGGRNILNVDSWIDMDPSIPLIGVKILLDFAGISNGFLPLLNQSKGYVMELQYSYKL